MLTAPHSILLILCKLLFPSGLCKLPELTSDWDTSMMTSPSRIVDLAAIIHNNTNKVDQFIQREGLPSPSFGTETPPQLNLPADITSARDAVIEAMDELHALLLGPMPSIFHELTQKASIPARIGLDHQDLTL